MIKTSNSILKNACWNVDPFPKKNKLPDLPAQFTNSGKVSILLRT